MFDPNNIEEIVQDCINEIDNNFVIKMLRKNLKEHLCTVGTSIDEPTTNAYLVAITSIKRSIIKSYGLTTNNYGDKERDEEFAKQLHDKIQKQFEKEIKLFEGGLSKKDFEYILYPTGDKISGKVDIVPQRPYTPKIQETSKKKPLG